MSDPLKYSRQPELQNPALVVGWNIDASKLGTKVIDYLNKKLGGKDFGEIEPVDFFPLGGVSIEDNIIQFPESKFYFFPGKDLAVFKSDPPNFEWYKFLNLVLDAAESYHVREIHTIGGMVSLGAHTTPRELIGVFNSPELKRDLSHYNITTGLDYESPPGQRPTLSSFLLWSAKRRNIPGVNLWVPIPFYLVTVDDPKAKKRVLEFFNERFDLQLDLSDIDEEIRLQNQKITEIRNSFPDIDEFITKLETNIALTEEESQKLAKEIYHYLKTERG